MSGNLHAFDERIQQYLDGSLDDQGAIELLEALTANPDLSEQVIRELRMEALLRSEVPWVEAETGRRLAEAFRLQSSRDMRGVKRAPAHFRWIPRIAAVAAALLIVGGLFALWLSHPVVDPSATGRVKNRDQILAQLRELDLDRNRLQETVKKPVVRRTSELPIPAKPAPFPGDLQKEREEAEEAQRRKDAEECARLLDLKRLLLETELGGGRPPEYVDEESGAPVIAAQEATPIEAGRVLFVEGEPTKAVLLRKTEHQVDLTAGTKLQCGDQIAVTRGGTQAAARIELKPGTTIDLGEEALLKVVDENAVRLETGQIYACVRPSIVVGRGADQDAASAAPFSLQTAHARYLMEEAQAEIRVSPQNLNHSSTARIDQGQVHLLSDQGHVMGRKGQEIYASASATPGRRDGFSTPIWRGCNLSATGLSFLNKGNPVVFSNDNTDQNFTAEYALALAHTGELDLRGIQITEVTGQRTGAGGTVTSQQVQLENMMQEIAQLRQTGLRVAIQPVRGATQGLERPPSGRFEDTVPVRSPAVDQLLKEARTATPERPLVIVVSGACTDVASAWVLDHEMSKRSVVITRNTFPNGVVDAWSFVIVLENYRCVFCSVHYPQSGLQQFGRLAGTRWAFLASRSNPFDSDFSQMACLTVPGFVKSVERVRLVRSAVRDLRGFAFAHDPDGPSWLVKTTDARLLVQEFNETFLRDVP